jgi:hypothetical protein
MPTGTWPLGWATGDIETAAEFKKGIGSLFDSTLVGSAANVDITSIVATYAHLLVVVYARGDTAAANTNQLFRFNGDTAANYDYQLLTGGGATVTAVEAFAQTSAFIGFPPANTAGANLFGVSITFIPHYAGSTNNKLALSVASSKTGTTTGLMKNYLSAGFWRSSAAINRVTLLPAAGNFVAGTRVTLYGMGA